MLDWNKMYSQPMIQVGILCGDHGSPYSSLNLEERSCEAYGEELGRP